ncbi:MAG: agmatinase [Candidatus Gastranaerophilales bacterium]|nr:agmatinase [Candidatus Gastranaerophilales bacterium]
MLNSEFISKSWLEASDDFEKSKVVLIGIPYDGTCSFNPGARFGPEQIRIASKGLEEYSAYQDKSLEDIDFYDAGELDLPFGDRDEVLKIIKNCTKEVIAKDKTYLGIGGEHLVTLPAFEAYYEKYPNLKLMHFDALADLRDEYLGQKLSHATVIRRITDIIGMENIVQVGLRSGTKEEFDLIKKHNTLSLGIADFRHKIEKFGNNPIFLTIDLDVLDPSIMSGTGTQEPGGLFFNEFYEYFASMKDLNIVAADVLELSPHYDPSGVSTATAAKIIRELILRLS